MKIDKSRAPARGWVKKALCAGAILGLAASMGTQTALANEFEFTPFSRIATLPVVEDGVGGVDHAATRARARRAAVHLAEYVARTVDEGAGGNWVLGGTSKECRKPPHDTPLADCPDAMIEDAILGIPSPDPIIKKANVMDFCNEHYAKLALGVAPITTDGKKVVNGYSHTPALPCKVSVWSDGDNIYVDMKDPNAIFRMFFTDVFFSEEMTDTDFADAISALPRSVKDEIKYIVDEAMKSFASEEGLNVGHDEENDVVVDKDDPLGPEYSSMDEVVAAVAAAPEESPYKHVGYTRKDGGVFTNGINGVGDDAKIVTQAIINTMSIHDDTDPVSGAGKHPTVIKKNGNTLDSILSPDSKWRSARSAPLPLPGKNYVIEACSPTYAKMAMGTGMHHVTALPCEITVQIIDRDSDGYKETLVVSYLDPHFMLGALFADITDEEKQAFADIPGYIMDDLQKIVAAALEFESGYELSKPFNIHYDMLPDEDAGVDEGDD